MKNVSKFVSMARSAHRQAMLFARQRMPGMASYWFGARKIYMDRAREAQMQDVGLLVPVDDGKLRHPTWRQGENAIPLMEVAAATRALTIGPVGDGEAAAVIAIADHSASIADTAISRMMRA